MFVVRLFGQEMTSVPTPTKANMEENLWPKLETGGQSI